MVSDPTTDLIPILNQYDLGELLDYERDVRGTVNTSFTIQTEKDGIRKKYFLRRYKRGICREELDFEHSLINQLSDLGFGMSAGVIKTRDGNTYVFVEGDGEPQNGVYYAIFDFLGGEDRYTWVSPVCSPTEIASAAEVLAEFHCRSCKVVPLGMRTEPKILELLPAITHTLRKALESTRRTVFDAYLLENADTIQRSIDNTVSALLQHNCGSMVNLVIHCDYHPGNMKFDGEKVVGLFDFDWSKVDLRCYDVALALWYFAACWGSGRDGELRLDDCEIFLATYQDTLLKQSDLEPLTAAELDCLPDMIAAANLYVLNWTLLDYLDKDGDPESYLIFLKHGVNSILWLEDLHHRKLMEEMLARLLDLG